MNRQDMVEAGAQGIQKSFKMAEWELPTATQEAYSRAVLDAVLPQITTVEQLQELPDGCLVVNESGQVFELDAGQVTLPYTNPLHVVDPVSVTAMFPYLLVWTP